MNASSPHYSQGAHNKCCRLPLTLTEDQFTGTTQGNAVEIAHRSGLGGYVARAFNVCASTTRNKQENHQAGYKDYFITLLR